jgi:hypothetical protein
MTGRIKLGAWALFTVRRRTATALISNGARVGPLHVTDRFADRAGGMRGRLSRGHGLRRLRRGRDPLERGRGSPPAQRSQMRT